MEILIGRDKCFTMVLCKKKKNKKRKRKKKKIKV
jgi:hypothetical protein